MNKIYYFSGTGNTLFVAKKLAERLNDTELIPIADLDCAQDVVFGPADTVGFFFPVYCFGVPGIVRRFIDRIVKEEPSRATTYFYACCTSGGMKGSAFYILEDALAERNVKLRAEFHCTMPSNYIPLSDPPSERRQEKLSQHAEERMAEFAEIVKLHRSTIRLRVFPFDLFGELIAKRAVDYISSYDKYFWLTDACDGCGICERICPASNIIVMNDLPTWRGHCEQCMACLQWCPKEAIQFKQITTKRKRYHHASISLEEMFRKR